MTNPQILCGKTDLCTRPVDGKSDPCGLRSVPRLRMPGLLRQSPSQPTSAHSPPHRSPPHHVFAVFCRRIRFRIGSAAVQLCSAPPTKGILRRKGSRCRSRLPKWRWPSCQISRICFRPTTVKATWNGGKATQRAQRESFLRHWTYLLRQNHLVDPFGDVDPSSLIQIRTPSCPLQRLPSGVAVRGLPVRVPMAASYPIKLPSRSSSFTPVARSAWWQQSTAMM